jgi:hypothetical protein
MTDQERETIRAIVRLEVESIVKNHLCSLTVGVLQPIVVATAQLQESAKQLIQGQALVEKALADRLPDDDEPWRESLDDQER